MISILIKILLVINLIYAAFIVCLFLLSAVPGYIKFRQRKYYSDEKDIVTIVPLKNGNEQILSNIKNLISSQPFNSSKVAVSIEDKEEPLYENLKLLEEKNPSFKLVAAGKPAAVNGKANNMNAAYKLFNPEFCAFMDADVIISKDNYFDMLRQFDDEKCGAVFSAAFYNHSTGIAGKIIRVVTNYFFGESLLLFKRVIKINYCAGAFMAFRKKALDEAGGVEAVLNYISDDATLGRNVFNAGYKIKVLNTPVFMPAENASGSSGIKHLFKWLSIVRTTMGRNYLLLPGTFYTGNIFLILILSLITGQSVYLSLIFFIFVVIFRLTSAIVQDLLIMSKPAGIIEYLITVFAGIVEPFVWLAGFFANRLSWSGRKYKLGKYGKILSVIEEKKK